MEKDKKGQFKNKCHFFIEGI